MAIDVEALYTKYGPMVMRRCRFLLRNEQKALDAMQDTFVRVLRYRRRLTAAAPSSLLYRIATNVCLNILRSEKRRSAEAGEDALLNLAAAGDLEESFIQREIIGKIFQFEKSGTREIAVLHYVDGLTLEETAAETGLSVSGVRKRLRVLQGRARARKEEYE